MSNEVSVGHGNLMGYELYDLVGLSENENAVVITVGAERLRVINHMGIVKDVLPAEVAGKRNHFSLRGSGFDMSQNPMRVGDTVKVVSGSHANMKGTVKHMFKGTVWLHSTSYLKNSGVFVSKNRSCLVSGSNFATPAMSASYKGVLEPTPSFAPGASPGSSLTGSTGSTPAVASRAGAGSGRGIGRDPIVGKTVKIKSGGFKGLLAQVVDATPTHLSVELLAKLKKVTIERSKAVEVGDQRGRIPDSRYAGANPYARDVNPMATPFHTADTPAYHQGSETPAYIAGSETPMYMDGSATPLAGSRTPGGELDELWNVNDIDRAYVHGNGNSVNTSMQNSPGSSYSASNRQGSFAPSTVSSFQPQTEYSMNSHSQPTGSASGYPVESTPMSVDQQSQYSDCASSVASNVAEVGSYHSGRSASTRMTESSSDTRGSEMASSLPVASHLEWEKNMVVRILGGSNANRMGVLQSEVRSDGTFTVALRTTDGVLTDTLTVHYSDLRLEDVVRRQMAKVLSGKYKGLIGKVMVRSLFFQTSLPFTILIGFICFVVLLFRR